jgi:hypothetical protein
MEIGYFEKYDSEEPFLYRQFRRADGKGWINSSETITGTPTVTCVEKVTGTDRSSEMISNVAVYADTYVIFKLKGGTAGLFYMVAITIVTPNTQVLTYKMEVAVL